MLYSVERLRKKLNTNRQIKQKKHWKWFLGIYLGSIVLVGTVDYLLRLLINLFR